MFLKHLILAINVYVFALSGNAIYAMDPTVYRAQEQLMQLGYDPGKPDGIYGKRTRLALLIFQRKHGLIQTGKLDSQTLDTLDSLSKSQ